MISLNFIHLILAYLNLEILQIFNFDSGYALIPRIYGITTRNIKMLPDDEEEIKKNDYSNELLDLKFYIENLSTISSYSFLILHMKNISKINTEISQKFDKSLIKAKEFGFFVTRNLVNGFKSEDTLIGAVPDYISLCYDKSNSFLQSNESPIILTIKMTKITKKTLSIFWHIKNKNLQNLCCYCQIPRSKSLCTRSEIILLCIIRKLYTLKSLTLNLIQNNKSSIYTFKNLTPNRLHKVIDAVLGYDPSLPTPKELNELIDMKSLMKIDDCISII